MGIFTFFGREIVADCGHKTKKRDKIRAYGKSTVITLPTKDNKTLYCHKCIEKMTIKCAWCGGVIFIGDPITLYTTIDKNYALEHAVLYKEDPLQFVGCLRWGCADGGADRAGYWFPPGEVYRVPTAYEMCIQDMQTGGDGVIIVNDLSKP